MYVRKYDHPPKNFEMELKRSVNHFAISNDKISVGAQKDNPRIVNQFYVRDLLASMGSYTGYVRSDIFNYSTVLNPLQLD